MAWHEMRTDQWDDFIAEHGGEYVPIRWFFLDEHVLLPLSGWTTRVDESVVQLSGHRIVWRRIRATVANDRGFWVVAKYMYPIHRLRRKLNRRTVRTGDAAFDDRYWIRSNDPPAAIRLFSRPLLRRALMDGGASTTVSLRKSRFLRLGPAKVLVRGERKWADPGTLVTVARDFLEGLAELGMTPPSR